MLRTIESLFTKHKLARRLSLFWALALISYVVYRTMQTEVILGIQSAGATVVVAFVGILATVIGFYQWHRQQDNKEDK